MMSKKVLPTWIKAILVAIFPFLLSSCSSKVPDKGYNYYEPSELRTEKQVRATEQNMGSEEIFLDSADVSWIDDFKCMTSRYEKINCDNHGCRIPLFFVRKDKPVPFMHHVVMYQMSTCKTEEDSSTRMVSSIYQKFFVHDTILNKFCSNDSLAPFNYDEFKSFRKYVYKFYIKKCADTDEVGEATYLDLYEGMKYKDIYPDYESYRKILGYTYCEQFLSLVNCQNYRVAYHNYIRVETDLSEGHIQLIYLSEKPGFKVQSQDLAIYISQDIYEND